MTEVLVKLFALFLFLYGALLKAGAIWKALFISIYTFLSFQNIAFVFICLIVVINCCIYVLCAHCQASTIQLHLPRYMWWSALGFRVIRGSPSSAVFCVARSPCVVWLLDLRLPAKSEASGACVTSQ